MPDNSFDIVSKVEMTEVVNAVQQAEKELLTRFDLKDSKSSIELNEKDLKITLHSSDDYKLKSVRDILETKLVKRKVPLKNLEYGPITPAASSTVRCEITLQQGIPIEKAREIVKLVKDSKLKLQASIQEQAVRISGKKKDELQTMMQRLRAKEDLDLDLQFINFRD